MVKIGFYLKNRGFATVDTRFVLEANPGIGGSEYEILCISYLLSMRENNIEVVLYVENEGVFPDINYKIVENLKECAKECSKDAVDILILDYKHHDKDIIDDTSSTLNYFIWAHNFITYKDLKYFSAKNNILRIVQVSKEALDLYRDHKSFYKSVYINNGVAVKNVDYYLKSIKLEKKRNQNVVYVGSLIPVKGFHLLAKVWKEVVKEIPSAQLFVIGNGKLYDRKNKLGTYGLAEESYENKFISHITEGDKIMSSVHFLGTLGSEKDEILSKCKIGVPNPSGNTETFGISAVEMQLMGCRIATIKCPGYICTVHSSNILYSNKSQLAAAIIKLLKEDKNKDYYADVYQFINDNFSFENVIKRWEFEILNFNENVKILTGVNNNYHLKKIKDILRIVKCNLPFANIIPPLELVWNLQKKLLNKFK